MHGEGAVARRSLCGVEDFVNGEDDVIELFTLNGQLLAPRSGERVIARAAIVFRGAPRGLDPASQEQTLQRRIQRAFADLQNVIGEVLHMLSDAVSMPRSAHECLED